MAQRANPEPHSKSGIKDLTLPPFPLACLPAGAGCRQWQAGGVLCIFRRLCQAQATTCSCQDLNQEGTWRLTVCLCMDASTYPPSHSTMHAGASFFSTALLTTGAGAGHSWQRSASLSSLMNTIFPFMPACRVLQLRPQARAALQHSPVSAVRHWTSSETWTPTTSKPLTLQFPRPMLMWYA